MNAETVKFRLWTGEELDGTVSAVIYRKQGNGVRVSAEVTDRNGRTVYIAEPKYLKFEERGKENE